MKNKVLVLLVLSFFAFSGLCFAGKSSSSGSKSTGSSSSSTKSSSGQKSSSPPPLPSSNPTPPPLPSNNSTPKPPPLPSNNSTTNNGSNAKPYQNNTTPNTFPNQQQTNQNRNTTNNSNGFLRNAAAFGGGLLLGNWLGGMGSHQNNAYANNQPNGASRGWGDSQESDGMSYNPLGIFFNLLILGGLIGGGIFLYKKFRNNKKNNLFPVR